MPVTKAPDDMSDMKWGLGIGCSIAILLMIFSCVLFIQELHEYLKSVKPPPSSTTPPPPTPPPRPDVPLPRPPPIRYESPPPYPTVVPAVHRGDSFIRTDRSAGIKSSIKPGPLDPGPSPPPPYVFEYRSPPPIVPVPLPDVDVHRPVYPRPVEVKCLLPVCEEYFRSLNLGLYFQQTRDCYCITCRPDNRQKTHKRGGYESTIPYGWVRFRIQTDQAHARKNRIFTDWATSYYGTCEEKLEQILRNRLMPLPGDTLSDGTIYSDQSVYGKQWLTSPSINYASDLRLSPMKTFQLPNRIGEKYNVQVVLQCKQKPHTFVEQAGRPGIRDVIPANVIEWTSNHRSTLIPTGLMIRMVKRS